MNKSNYIRIRISTEEKLLLKEKAKENNMSLSNYIRFSALSSGKIETKTTTEIIIK